MRETIHPENLKTVNSLEITSEISSFVSELSKDIETERGNRAQWESKIDELHDLRFGYRLAKTTPWRGAANYSLPLIDAHISKAKPSYIGLISANPVCTFVPFGGEDVEPAKKKEILFDWRMRTKVKPFKAYAIGVDKALEQGSVVFKVIWNYSTRTYQDEINLEELDQKTLAALYDPRVTDEMLARIIIEELGVDPDFEENIEQINKGILKFREGKTKLRFTFTEVEHNQPELTACDLRHDLVIPVDTTDLQYARFIDQPFYRTTNQLKIAMRDEKYIEYEDEKINAWARIDPKRKYQVSTGRQDDIILLHESCVWYDINGDGIKERCIATWPDASPADVLRFIEVPYDHGLFPYILVRREYTDYGIYSSRGYAALDEDYQKGISNAVNQAENSNTVSMPVVVMRQNTVTNLKNRRYIPMETVETRGDPNDYQIRQLANISQPVQFQMAQYLKSWADQRLGNVTSGLSNENNLPGMGQGGKKTKAEIDLISSLQGEVNSLDLQIWQDQMADVYFQIDALYDQYGDDEEEIVITGQPPQKITRRDVQAKANIVPNGKFDNTNQAARTQKAFNLMQMFINDPDINQYELKKLFLTDYDHKIAQRILYTEQEIAKKQQMQMQMMEQMKMKAQKEGMDLKQIDILMDVWKEGLLEPITGKKFAPDKPE